MTKALKNNIIGLYSFEQFNLFNEMLNGYEESFEKGGICPTQVYLYANRKDSVWENLDFYHQDNTQLLINVSNQYDLKRRLSLGLPVAFEEYSQVSDWLESMNNFR
ncbi:MAG: hypothetical protein E7158_02980 [Firmicutes bacterium]|nr:hypothetical protein [Bacillota bacterium]